MKLGVIGRSQTFNVLKQNISKLDKTIWFHCASLGEYEQGLPVFQEIRNDYPHHKIVLSFFSPSGYEIRKNAPIADVVVYLPLDTKQNANIFVDLVDPDLVVFVKYEIWPNYLNALKSKKIRTLLISALFRKDQVYFKPYGSLMRNALTAFEHIFVQDKASKENLESISLTNVTISGDTRFDRVGNQLNLDNALKDIALFKDDKLCIVAGSTWPEDEALLIDFINTASQDVKFIIAPHNIKEKQILNLKNQLIVNTVLYSQSNPQTLANSQTLIIDNIGMLNKVYSYADIAYVGGAMGNTGLHNTLEPAVFGIPIIIGAHHSKFPEASEMILNQGMFSISTSQELKTILTKLIDDKTLRLTSGKNNINYIQENQGAVIQIMHYIRR